MTKLVRTDHPAIGTRCKECDGEFKLNDDLTTRELTDDERDEFAETRSQTYLIGPGGFAIHQSCAP